ncbi:hypothetical protein ACFL54_03655 [Planctomycetota bacterium]
MPKYCPQCREEYQDNMDSCADCGESLVFELDSMGEDADLQACNMQQLCTGPTDLCKIIVTHLECTEIKCLLENSNTPGQAQDENGSEQSIVLVDTSDYELAMKVLSDLEFGSESSGQDC